jgi:hypothetical protein
MKVLNSKLFLLMLAIVLSLSMSLAIVACGDDDDDDDDDDDTFDGFDDDDDDDDDDATPGDDDDDVTPPDDDDDDTTDDDDDTAPQGDTCADIGDGFYNICGYTLSDGDGVQQDEAGLVEWCGLSEGLYAKSDSVFWNCLGTCVFDEFCDDACFDDCLAPADPGGTDCGHTVNGIYNCDVIFLFTDSRLWIPELDMHNVCDLFEDDWACYQTCIDSECDGGASQGSDLIDCMTANC